MDTIIRDSFEPDHEPRRERVQDLSDELLRELVVSGSREAARELMRRQDG